MVQKIEIRCITKGVPKDIRKAMAENLQFKKHYGGKMIKTEMDKLIKVKDLEMPQQKGKESTGRE